MESRRLLITSTSNKRRKRDQTAAVSDSRHVHAQFVSNSDIFSKMERGAEIGFRSCVEGTFTWTEYMAMGIMESLSGLIIINYFRRRGIGGSTQVKSRVDFEERRGKWECERRSRAEPQPCRSRIQSERRGQRRPNGRNFLS